MNGKACFRVALWAAGSFIAGIPLVMPHSINAVSNDVNGVINKPKFVVGSCAVTMDNVYPEEKSAWETGDKANFRLTAVNDSSEDQDLTFKVSISAMPPTSELSRTLPMYREVESLPVSIHAPAGKTVSTDLNCAAALPAGSIRVQFVQNDKSAIMATIVTAKDITIENNQQNARRINAEAR